MTIRAVIWDMGGVLLRTEDPKPRQQFADRLGIPLNQLANLVFDSQTATLATIGKMSARAHWESVCQALGLPLEEFQAVQDGFWGGDRVDDSLVEYIRSLRTHYQTGLLSNAWDDARQYLEEKFGITDAFDALVISAEVGVAKPDPQIYQIALGQLKVAPQESVFIDDVQENVEAARALNMYAIQFQNSTQARAELEQILHKETR